MLQLLELNRLFLYAFFVQSDKKTSKRTCDIRWLTEHQSFCGSLRKRGMKLRHQTVARSADALLWVELSCVKWYQSTHNIRFLVSMVLLQITTESHEDTAVARSQRQRFEPSQHRKGVLSNENVAVVRKIVLRLEGL